MDAKDLFTLALQLSPEWKVQMAGRAMDEVCKELHREGADLHDGMWALRGNEWTRSKEQAGTPRCALPHLSEAGACDDAARTPAGHPRTGRPGTPALVVQASQAQPSYSLRETGGHLAGALRWSSGLHGNPSHQRGDRSHQWTPPISQAHGTRLPLISPPSEPSPFRKDS